MKIAQIRAVAVTADFLVPRGFAAERVSPVHPPAVEQGRAHGVRGTAERTPHTADAGTAELRLSVFHDNVLLRTDRGAFPATDAGFRRAEGLAQNRHGGVLDPKRERDETAEDVDARKRAFPLCEHRRVPRGKQLRSAFHPRRHSVRVAENNVIGHDERELAAHVEPAPPEDTRGRDYGRGVQL